MRVGLISDTHLPSLMHSLDQLGPQVGEALESVDLILHAGDVHTRRVLDWLEQFAPVVTARGNHDMFEDTRIEQRQLLELEGWSIGMVHDLRPEGRPMAELVARDFAGVEPDIVISGDTHVDRLEFRDGRLLINSGSPNLPHHKETRLGTVGLLELAPGRLRAEIVVLGDTEGAPNPGTARHMEIVDGRVVTASENGAPTSLPLPSDDGPGR
jgi:hypothetical protein